MTSGTCMGFFVVEPQQFLERIRAQAGAFLVSAFHQRFEMEKISLWDKGAPGLSSLQVGYTEELQTNPSRGVTVVGYHS